MKRLTIAVLALCLAGCSLHLHFGEKHYNGEQVDAGVEIPIYEVD